MNNALKCNLLQPQQRVVSRMPLKNADDVGHSQLTTRNTDGLFLTRKPPPARSPQTQPVTPFRPTLAVTVSVGNSVSYGNSRKNYLCCQYVDLYVFCYPLY